MSDQPTKRFFLTSNASRQYYGTGGRVFTFEPTEQVGGGWRGVLALEESDANILAVLIKTTPQIQEITVEQFEDAKKKHTRPSSFTESPVKPRNQPPRLQVVPPAAPSANPASIASPNKPAGPAVTLATTTEDPPLEFPDETAKPGARKS